MLFARSLLVVAAMLVVSGCMQTNTGLLATLDGMAVSSAPLPDAAGPVVGPAPGPVVAVAPVPVVEAAPVPVALPEPPPLPPVVPLIGAGPHQVEPTYTLGTGDKLRVIVYGQDGLTNTYSIDAAGRIDMPLIGFVSARGLTTARLAGVISARLRNGYIREPHVSVEVEAYRPFFILGEVTYPGQYPFVPRMTVETAVAIAGGYTPRAYRWSAEVTRPTPEGPVKLDGPPMFLLMPGDTVSISERWF